MISYGQDNERRPAAKDDPDDDGNDVCDPRAFPDPGQFRPYRPDSRRHVAFGLGTHLCLGAELARSEGRAALR
jgi:hypothetical protein